MEADAKGWGVRYREARGETSQVKLSRRGFVAAVAAVAAAPRVAQGQQPAATSVAAFDLDELTIAQLQKYTSQSLVEKYLARIQAVDRAGPTLRAVIETNPDALAIAQALDQERKAKGPRGPLHGIPILIKDNIETADRMMTTAGSLALEGSIAARDSFVAQKLRAAGAVILGKTNLSEWANFRSTHSTSGWSGRGGLTRNPYALDRNTSGSSSGSGAGTAANLCAAAVGSETDGSIVSPSAMNALVGIKPTVGLISRSGIVPISINQDTAGPMARTVADAATLLTVLAGVDPNDPYTQASAGKAVDYTKFLDPNGLRGARIGIARKFFGYNRDVDALMETAIAEMKRLGAVIVDPADLPTHGKFDDSEFDAMLYEFKDGLNRYLAGTKPNVKVRSLDALIAFNEKNSTREMPYFGQEILLQAQKKGPLTEKAYKDAVAKNRLMSRGQGIDAVLSKDRLHAIFAPAGGPAWLTDLVTGDHDIGGSSTPAAVAGYPNITVPAGFVHALPVGASFFGAAWSEGLLIKIASGFEAAVKARKKPEFLRTAAV
jgi:amidase